MRRVLIVIALGLAAAVLAAVGFVAWMATDLFWRDDIDPHWEPGV